MRKHQVLTACIASLGMALVLAARSNGIQDRRAQSIIVDAADYGIVCDGVADDGRALQHAIDSLPTSGGLVYVRPSQAGSRCKFSTTLRVPDGAKIIGAGKWATVLRYTGHGSAFLPAGSKNGHAAFENFTLQLTEPLAVGIDAARLISSTFRSIRIAWSGTHVGGTGIRAKITDTSWTSYFNVLEDITFDGLAQGILVDSSVAQHANRWRIIAPTVLAPQAPNVANGIVLNDVRGIDIIGATCDQIGGACIKLGAGADRVTIVAGRLESSYGGTMFAIHPAANRTTIIGYQVHAGTSGARHLGTRASLLGQWGDGIRWTESSASSPATEMGALGRKAERRPNRVIISGTETQARVSFDSAEVDGDYIPVVTRCGAIGSPAIGSNRLWVSDLETTGFNVHAEVAPGVGNGVVVCWYRTR